MKMQDEEFSLEGFNKAQLDAVLYCAGPSLVIAGAGSGKTRVLTYKIAYLLKNDYTPWSILALTFTNKAANEMKQRIADIVGEDIAKYLWMGTFHSIFLKILRIEHEKIGFSANFTIYDAADSKSLIKSIIKEMGLDEKIYKPSAIAGRISMAKNELVDAEDYYNSYNDYKLDQSSGHEKLRDIYRQYSNRCKQADSMDFDDILLYTYKLLSENPDVAAQYEHRFHYVLVDEYQDTNFAQHKIVWLLTQNRQNVCVVGDDAQSIYSFRGAKIDNILQFTSLYHDAKIFKLEQNYRSSQTIVEAANSLIRKNKRQIEKSVFSKNEVGDKIKVVEVHSDILEGDAVLRQMRLLRSKEEKEYSDFAILYRTNAQSRVFEEALRKASVPYKIYGGLSFYQRKEIKDVIAYFRVAVNPNDEEAIKRIINYPTRGIGQTTLNKIIEAASRNGVSLWQVICEPLSYGLSISSSISSKLQGFKQLICSFIQRATEEDADKLGVSIIKESGIFADVSQDKSPENLSRQENLQELQNGMTSFVEMRREEGGDYLKLVDYLSEVSLLSEQDSDLGDDEPKVTLMTIHSAKGLEFDTVFIVGLEEDLFPNQMASGSSRELEEERRLLYVAITRAKHHCMLSYAKNRFRFGSMEICRPSRFLKDIDPTYLSLDFSSQGLGFSSEIRFRNPNSCEDRRVRFQNSMKKLEERFFNLKKVDLQNLQSVSTSSLERQSDSQINVSSRVLPTANHPFSANSASSPNTQNVNAGNIIMHERFGRGVVEKVENAGDTYKITVRFDAVGLKQLLLKYAKIKIIQ